MKLILFLVAFSPSGLAFCQPDSLIRYFSRLNSSYILNRGGLPPKGYLYMEARAGKFVPKENKRLPLNISLVLDRSGSMSGDKIEYVRRAASFVVDNLQTEDILSIVSYDDRVEIEYPSSQVLNKELIKNKIKNLTDRGSTNLSGGMLEGFRQVKSTYKSGYVNRVLLLSDGLANAGVTDPTILQNIVTDKMRSDGISLSTFGVGADFNEDLMTNLAEHGSGNYYFIESPDKIPAIFDQELKGLLSVVAQNMELNLTLPEGVQVEKVFGYPFKIEKGILKVDFRDVFSEDIKGVLIRFKLNEPLKTAYQFHSVVRFAESQTGKDKSLESNETLTPTSDSLLFASKSDSLVDNQITLFEANEVLKEAALQADKRNFKAAQSLIRQNSILIKKKIKPGSKSNKEIMALDSMNTKYEESLLDIDTKSELEYKLIQKGVKSETYKIKTKRMKK
jgi:Ca-activated chloride channel family protein